MAEEVCDVDIEDISFNTNTDNIKSIVLYRMDWVKQTKLFRDNSRQIANFGKRKGQSIKPNASTHLFSSKKKSAKPKNSPSNKQILYSDYGAISPFTNFEAKIKIDKIETKNTQENEFSKNRFNN